jgi:hypothetical protein
MSSAPNPELLRRLGIFNYEGLAELAVAGQEYRIEKLIPRCSIGLRVGDSNFGKTPLSMQEGIAIASGKHFLGFPVRQGRVLYCDAESGLGQCAQMIRVISGFLGLCAPPQEFHLWSPNFDPRDPPAEQTLADILCEQVKALRPDHVVVDPLRAFWPDAEEKSREAMAMIRCLRLLSKEIGCSWTLNHHRRKRDAKHVVSIENDRHIWFEESAGAHALINGSDTRLGVEAMSTGRGDLILAGFVRAVGWIGSMYLERTHDDNGEPLGYRHLSGVDHLNVRYRQAYGQLPGRFRFKDAHASLGGTSDSSTSEFLKQCITLGVLKKEGPEYVKVE